MTAVTITLLTLYGVGVLVTGAFAGVLGLMGMAVGRATMLECIGIALMVLGVSIFWPIGVPLFFLLTRNS